MGANCCSNNTVVETNVGVEIKDDFEVSTGPRKFSYHEIVQATGDFLGMEKLGEGGCGEVYKVFLEDQGIIVAIKRVSQDSQQGIKQFAAEVKVISQLRHKNLVQLIGWCRGPTELLLIYEFMEMGSLDIHLFSEKPLLAWPTRYKIARGLATALQYLHEGWESCVLHRDVKSSNVLLDTGFNTKLGDFGLAMLLDHTKTTQTMTTVAGTRGYMAPEYLMTNRASKESDVYSFGVVALEIACGRKPISKSGILLADRVLELYKTGALLEAADPRLHLDYEEEEIKRLMIVGLCCAHPDASLRPLLGHVIRVLQFEAPLPEVPPKIQRITYGEPPSSSSDRGNSFVEGQSSSKLPSSSFNHGNSKVKGQSSNERLYQTATF